jgi:hypothetical protein
LPRAHLSKIEWNSSATLAREPIASRNASFDGFTPFVWQHTITVSKGLLDILGHGARAYR